ncbi:MAG TPA: hypothetical protein VGH14_05480 [Solirubrobacterales bacterium]|jgi:hypothetical protein
MDRTGTHHPARSSAHPRGSRGRRVTVLFLCLGVLAALTWGVGAPAASAASCSTGTIEGSFSAPAAKGSIATNGQVDCYELPGSTAGEKVSVGLVVSSSSNANPYWRIVDQNGTTICTGWTGPSARCELNGAPGWSIEVESNGGSGTFPYAVAVRDVSDPQACSAALGDPGGWSYTKARTNGSIAGTLGAQCYTFDRAEGEADGAYWFRAVRTAGNLNPQWTVYGPSGEAECSGTNGASFESCGLRAFGKYALVVAAQYGDETGSFYLSPRRLNGPEGCSSISSLSFSTAPTTGSVASAGQTDCYALAGAAAEEDIVVSSSVSGNSGASPAWAVVDNGGSRICGTSMGSVDSRCVLSGTGPWSLVVYDQSGGGNYSYTVAVRDVSDPQGCSAALGEPGQWSFTKARTNGSISGTLGAQCYTFDRAEGEADGDYWFRAVRTAGSFSPQWTVYGPSGSPECAGSENGYRVTLCTLRASGRYALVVDDPSGLTGSYFLTADRLDSPTGCTAMPAQQFGSAAVTGNLSTAGTVDCRTLEGMSVADRVRIGVNTSGASGGNPRWSVINGDGEQICGSYEMGFRTSCELTGAAGWSILVFGEGAGTFSYSLSVRRLDDPQGCSAALGEPGEWSFTKARTNGSISGTLGAQCYTFDRAEGEADGAYWFRAVRTAGVAEPEWTVYGPAGERECSGGSGGAVQPCDLAADGRYAMVVESNSGEGSGSYVVSAKRLNAPVGCAALKSPTFGIGLTHGNLSTAGEIDCYAVRLGSRDELLFHQTGAANQVSLLDEHGDVLCQGAGFACRVNEDGAYSVLVYAGGAESGSYQFEAACQNEPCGVTETAIREVDPTRVGQGRSMSLLLRGHDLELLEKIKIKRGGTTIEGQVVPGSDGRSVEVRFDLSEAEVGIWEIEGEFADGSKRQLVSALHVEPAGSPIITVHLVGREVFRTFHKIPVSVEVSNTGNVDALGVPVVLSGLPTGSTVEPQFELVQPEGELESPTFSPAQFEPDMDAVESNGEMSVPLIVPRVPAEGSVDLNFNVMVPSGGVSYLLRAWANQCLAGGAEEGAAVSHAARLTFEESSDPVTHCADEFGKTIAGELIDAVPGVSCFKAGGDIGSALAKGFVWPMLGIDRPKIFTAKSIIDFGLNAAGCASLGGASLAKPVVHQLVSDFVDDAGKAADAASIIDACYAPTSQSKLPQRQVTAIDPNELVGPGGTGSQHYISGELPLQYKVFFENTPQATAPAQRIEITDQLDTSKFEPGSVLFSSFHFGHQSLVLPYPEPSVDETIDLQPAEDLEVHVTAGVTPGGTVQVVLQSIDPETLAPPSDPEVGLLPPNASPPEGEGSLAFTVAPRGLPSGTNLSNQASIVFDDNAPIVTDAWTNKLDKAAPVPTVSALGGAEPLQASVSWGGTDDASGIELWKVEVSKDGGPFEFWRSASAAGSETFVAASAGTYSFRATASDGAGNSGQSPLAAVTLAGGPGGAPTGPGGGTPEPGGGSPTPGDSTEPGTEGGPGGGGTGSPAAAPSPTTSPSTPPASQKPKSKPMPKQCKKGFKKKKAHGKTVCVRLEPRHKAKSG